MKRESLSNNGIAWDETGQLGAITGPDGQPVSAIPPAVLLNMINTGQIPVLEIKWGDERPWCKYAHDGDAAGAARCNCLVSEPGSRPWCGLNGRDRKSPCLFDEPDDHPVWQEIRASQAAEKGARR